MNDASADKYVEQFYPALQEATTDEHKKRFLRLLVKEVERDTRHKAYDVVQACLQTISNLDHTQTR